jgi:hypothetical protein
VFVGLTGNLFGGGQLTLHRTEVDQHEPRVVGLLDDAGDDVALTSPEVSKDGLVLEFAHALHDHLACGGRRDPAKSFGGVLELLPGLAADTLLARLPLFSRPHRHVSGLAVQLDPGVPVVPLRPLVGTQQRLLDGADDNVQRDVPLALERAQHAHVDVHQRSSPEPGRANST